MVYVAGVGAPEASGETLRVGVAQSAGATVSNVNAAAVTLARLEELCSRLARALGVRVRAVQPKSYEELGRDVADGRIELAWLPPVVASRLAQAGRVLPLALPVRRGKATFYTALFVREDSPITTLDQLKSARAAWVDPSSASGYAVIRAALRTTGRRVSQAIGSEHFEGSHQGVVRAVLEGRADVGATYCQREPGGGVLRGGWGDAKVRVLLDYGPIPSDILAVGMKVPGPVIQRLRQLIVLPGEPLVIGALRELFEAEGFVRAEPAHFAPLASLLAHLDAGPVGPSVAPGC